MSKPDLASSIGQDHVLIERRGAATILTLNRVAAHNAITTAMRARIAEAIPRLARDADTYAVVLQSASDRVFSAGGDVREVVAWARERPEEARRSLAEEYALCWLLECFSKPTVALIDGLTVGSGVGLTAFNTHRVAGDNYRFAMPETGIGLFPDDGVAHILAGLPDDIGMYLGLTGRTIGRADAFALGLVTHCVSADRYEEIRAGLAEAMPVDPLLEARHADPGPGALAPNRDVIRRCFSGRSVEDIVARLRSERYAGQEFAEGVLADLARASPLSLKITYRHIREARALGLRLTLQRDYRIASRLIEGGDFFEGVRARLIDRDNAPRWQHARIEDVPDSAIDRLFAPMGTGELVLKTRQEMQSARV
jgi:enoyl-CoA hydratase